MPLKTWNLLADFDAHYDISGEPEGHPNTRPEIRLHYHRKVMLPWFERHMPDLVRVLGLQPAHRIVIVGCAFGWSIEVLNALGFANVVGTDTSPYIQAAKSIPEDNELALLAGAEFVSKVSARQGLPRTLVPDRILNENLGNNASRSRVRTAVGGTPNWTISEGVLESLTNAEAQALSTNMRALGGTIAHRITYPTSIPGYNSNTPEQWKALLTPDLIVHVPSWQVL